MVVDGVEYFGTVQIGNALTASKTATSYLIRSYSQGKLVVNVAGWGGAMLAMYHTSRKENRKKDAVDHDSGFVYSRLCRRDRADGIYSLVRQSAALLFRACSAGRIGSRLM